MMKQQDYCGNVMEAVAVTLNYFNIWRWLALTLSFWKIRSGSASADDGNSPNPVQFSENKPMMTDTTDDDDDHDEEEASPPPSVDDEGPTPTPTKGKFTVYYYGEEHVEVEQEAMDADAYDDEWEEGLQWNSEWWESWEGFLKLRLGHNHNTSLDFKAINGNLVTLWHPHNQHYY
ncbi:hypothetical protein PIB30_083190 [Stylosanthes scabra]|uniref:Uncharacterized protein n=1 Tax=Stylosanthes scabra TaxID=79078 RepID=A0ABU6WRZ1_9FABA|nr:hypothetical protein [Stylosanthes scabra]